MRKNEHQIIIKQSDGRLFDLFAKNRYIFITDFSLLTHELVLASNNNIVIGEEHKRNRISSIAEIKSAVENIIESVIPQLNEVFSVETFLTICVKYPNIEAAKEDMLRFAAKNIPADFNRKTFFPHFDFNTDDEDKTLLVDQLVFDVLFDKYLRESKRMTRNEYAEYLAKKFCSDKSDKISFAHAANERLTRAMGAYHDRMTYSNLGEQLELLGNVPKECYISYYIPQMKDNLSKNKPQYIWDLLWYNSYLPLSARQYRRQLTKENRNYSYEAIFNDLKEYNHNVTKLLPVEHEEYKKYFRMSMDYYVLECYKRIDFMFKLISFLPQTEIKKINKEHPLVKRFHPMVLVPVINNGELCYFEKCKYYRPLFMIESEMHKKILQEIALGGAFDYSKYYTQLWKFQIIRAKAYELFKYHNEFDSIDYEEIKDFLCKCYDMRSYHQSNDIWKIIQNMKWDKMSGERKQQIIDQLRKFISINDALFWKSPDREYTKPKNE